MQSNWPLRSASRINGLNCYVNCAHIHRNSEPFVRQDNAWQREFFQMLCSRLCSGLLISQQICKATKHKFQWCVSEEICKNRIHVRLSLITWWVLTKEVPCFDTSIPIVLSWPLSSFVGDVYCIILLIIYGTTVRLITVVFLITVQQIALFVNGRLYAILLGCIRLISGGMFALHSVQLTSYLRTSTRH